MAQPYQQPNYNSDGEQVWNPTVGRYFEPAKNQRESYGGIVGALQDQLFRETGVAKSYPHNFAGIIAAIEDLTFTQDKPPVDPDVSPPDGDVIIGPDGNPTWEWIKEPRDGTLWYDTRQGRLFIAYGSEYYQTNGADGLAQVTKTGEQTEHPVVGQFWWDVDTQALYIFDGFWRDPDGNIKDNFQPGYTPVWRLVVEDGGTATTVTTATLPLAPGTRVVRQPAGEILPELDESQFFVQKQYNEWLYDALEALEAAIESEEYSAPIEMGTTPPANPEAGDLWYDTNALELSIYYVDNDTAQWIPTAVSYNYDDQLSALSNQLILERTDRDADVAALATRIDGVVHDGTLIQNLQNALTAVEVDLASRPVFNANDFTTAAATSLLRDRVAALEVEPPDFSNFMSRSEINDTVDTLTSAVLSRASLGELAEVRALIPSIVGLVTQNDIDTSIANITTDYLPRNGGTVDGSFVINKTSYDEPAFDFSQESWSSVNALKFRTNSAAQETATFGTTGHAYEYAWNFSGNEDFCWVYNDSNKVFSITNEGPACSTLYFGDIQENDNNGRVIFNKIDVKERLNTYQAAFQQMRQGVANATDFDSLKANIISALANV